MKKVELKEVSSFEVGSIYMLKKDRTCIVKYTGNFRGTGRAINSSTITTGICIDKPEVWFEIILPEVNEKVAPPSKYAGEFEFLELDLKFNFPWIMRDVKKNRIVSWDTMNFQIPVKTLFTNPDGVIFTEEDLNSRVHFVKGSKSQLLRTSLLKALYSFIHMYTVKDSPVPVFKTRKDLLLYLASQE